jgi:ATP-dependent DNA helicase RecG
MASVLPINVDDLLRASRVESSRLEFKQTWNEGPTAWQILHTICAFANDLQNLNGGYVVLGVEAEGGLARLPPSGLSPQSIEKAQKWIRGQCNRLDPPYQPVLSPEVIGDRHILVIWAPGSETRPHRAPKSAAKESHYYVRLGCESIEASGELLAQLLQLTARVPFDDRRAPGVPLEKVREARVREFLSDIKSGLLEQTDARVVYRLSRISAKANDHEVPKNIGLLFFSDDPEEWFSGARIEVVQFAGDSSGNVIEEKVFRGPLHHQLRDAISYLRSFSTQHLLKLRDRPEAKGWLSYPVPALDEAIVNAVYHRSYEGPPEPTKVYLYPDRIEVISYPGPVPGIELRHLEPGGQIPPVPARNRRIGEFLKELRLAEGRGTGIPKLYRAMEQNGSPRPRFDFDESRSYFRVTLPAHPEYIAISALRDSAHLRAVGDVGGALVRLQSAFREHPVSATLAAALIEELAHAERLAEAESVFEEFSRNRAPGLARVVTALSAALLSAGLNDRAREVLDSLPQHMSFQETVDAAIAERRAGRDDRAHALFERVGESLYQDARALHEFAQAKLHLAKPPPRGQHRDRHGREARLRLLREARSLLERVVHMDVPNTRRGWAWFDLGRVHQWSGAPASQVRSAFEEALRACPGEERFQGALEKLRDRL